jgi:hypothetical protein
MARHYRPVCRAYTYALRVTRETWLNSPSGLRSGCVGHGPNVNRNNCITAKTNETPSWYALVLMLRSNILLPFLAAIVGVTFAVRLYGQDAWVTGAAVGFGVGCAILALVWLLFALLKRWVG